MFEKLSADQYFIIIKENHENYLKTNMVTHLEFTGAANKKPIIEGYQTQIELYHQLQKEYLDYATQGASTSDALGMGVTAALIGMGISGVFFAEQQRMPSADFLGAKAITQGGFSAMIGGSCAAVIYHAWKVSNKKPAQVDEEECIKQMQRAGFTDTRYNELSKDLVKLFHFRECLLLGLKDNHKSNMREGFKDNYFPAPHRNKFNDADFNLSIELYFLEKLSDFFEKALQDIYQIHNQEILDDHGFNGWIKEHFESEKNRHRFTQEMQIKFMSQCIGFLQSRMEEPSFLAKYIYIIDSIAGLIAGFTALTVLAVMIPIIPTSALIGIGLVSGIFSAMSLHLTITKNTQLYYERSRDNRDALNDAIQKISSEQKRLIQAISKVVKTTNKDLEDLKNFDNQDNSSFLKLLHIQDQPHLFTGSVHSWIRELASRFQDSKFIKIDLSHRVKSLVNDAFEQTTQLQERLLSLRASGTDKDAYKTLMKYIKDTRHYLQHKDNQAFIKTFESVQKIKEELLEVIGYQSLIQTTKGLPSILVEFYTDPVSKGGLGGLKSDLIQAQRLAPIVSATIAADAQHPYHHLLDTAFTMNLRLKSAQNSYTNPSMILQGDSQYRKMLGFLDDHALNIEDQIHAGNIVDYLNASFDFLCSLNEYNGNNDWTHSFQNHDQFIVYRMLLVKQLANFADPNNIRVDPFVKSQINSFIRIKLNGDPDVALDDILHEAWLMKEHKDTRVIKDKLGNSRQIGELASIADAIRVDITYVSNPLSPEKLITFEATLFLNQQENPYLFACLSSKQIVPEYSAHFYSVILETIKSTNAFIALLNTKTLLQQTGAIRIYIQEISKEVDRLIDQINTLMAIPDNPTYPQARLPMQDILQSLQAFKSTLPPMAQATQDAIHVPDELKVEYFDLEESKADAPTSHIVSDVIHSLTRHSPIHILTHPPKDNIAEAIKILTGYERKDEQPKNKGMVSSIFHHHKTDIKSAQAILRLKNALIQIQQGEQVDTYDWNEDETYRTNRQLSDLIKAHFPEGLNHFFQQQSLQLIA